MSNNGYVLDQEVVQPIDPDQRLISDITKGRRKAQVNKDRRKKIQPEMQLWAAIIKQAVADLEEPEHRNKSRHWLLANDLYPGSLLWICEQLGLNVLEVRALAGVSRHSPQVAGIGVINGNLYREQ